MRQLKVSAGSPSQEFLIAKMLGNRLTAEKLHSKEIGEQPVSKQNSKKTSNLVRSEAGEKTVLTVYEGFAVVQQTRPLHLKDGANQIQLEGMPTQYLPSTLVVLDFEGAGTFTLGPVSYQQANFTAQTILSRSVGKQVNLKIRSNAGRQRSIEGKLLSVLGDQLLIEKASGKPALVRFQDLEETELLDGVPEGLNEKAYLAVAALAESAGSYKVRVLFRTGGLTWSANHSAVYDESQGRLTRLDSSVFVVNNSGASYHDAELHLLAGNIGQQGGGYESGGGGMRMMAAAAPQRHSIRQAKSQTVGEHKLYTAPTAITLNEGESLQVPLFQATEVPVVREYFLPQQSRYQGYQQNEGEGLTPVSIRLKLVNDADHKLGNPLPAGEVSIYQPDNGGTLQLTGNASLDHVATGEAFGLTIGTSTDIKAERKQVESYEEAAEDGGEGGDEGSLTSGQAPQQSPMAMGGPQLGRPGVPPRGVAHFPQTETEDAPKYHIEKWEVTVHNFKADRAVEVVVMEEFPGNYELIESSHEFAKETSTRSAATVKVEAGSRTTLSYSVRVKDE